MGDIVTLVYLEYNSPLDYIVVLVVEMHGSGPIYSTTIMWSIPMVAELDTLYWTWPQDKKNYVYVTRPH